jgi:hypothetical protein
VSRSAPEAQLWAFDRCKAYPLPDYRVLVRNQRTGRQAVLTPDVYGALQMCTHFHTFAEHAKAIAAAVPGMQGQEADIQRVLESVQADGLMINAAIYELNLQGSAQPAMPADKAVAAVITWERPEALARCLDSLRRNSELENLAAVFVIDDSRSKDAQQRNRASTEALAEHTRVPVHYMGAQEQAEFMQQLISKVPALEGPVRFLLDRERWAEYWTSGLSRTVALLLSAGKRLLVLDDDILCEVFEPPRQQREASFADHNRDARFFDSFEQWQEYRASAGTDPLLRHLSCLGSTLGDSLAAVGSGRIRAHSFRGAEANFVATLRPDSPVMITECGAFGDPGTSRMDWLTGLEDASMQAMLESDESVERALNNRNCWIGRHQAQVVKKANMSQLTGLDNRKLLPPYIPIMRGEDRLFGDMVQFLHPGSVALDQGWAVPHLPIPPREWSAEDRSLSTLEPFPTYSMLQVSQHMDRCPAREPLNRLAYLGRVYEDLSRMDFVAISALYLDRRMDTQANDYRHLKNLLDEHPDAPQAWQAFVQQGISELGRELVSTPLNPTLSGYPPGLENEKLAAWWQSFWRDFSHALQAWPAIRLAARQLLGNS